MDNEKRCEVCRYYQPVQSMAMIGGICNAEDAGGGITLGSGGADCNEFRQRPTEAQLNALIEAIKNR